MGHVKNSVENVGSRPDWCEDQVSETEDKEDLEGDELSGTLKTTSHCARQIQELLDDSKTK